jgi:hypothetical protein
MSDRQPVERRGDYPKVSATGAINFKAAFIHRLIERTPWISKINLKLFNIIPL